MPLKLPKDMSGVLVFASNGRALSFRGGDLIRKVEGQPVKKSRSLRGLIQQPRESGVTTVLINRIQRGEESVVTLEL